MRQDNELFSELKTLLSEGQKIEAIKRYRAETGADLATAKAAIEALERDATPPVSEPTDSVWEAELRSLLEQGQKITAIKRFRERTGAGLQEAKLAVEAFAAQRGIKIPAGAGCLGVLVLLAALAGWGFVA